MLKWENRSGTYCAIHKIISGAEGPPSAQLTEVAREHTKRQIEEQVSSFATGIVKSAIKEFNLEGSVRDEYTDKNIIYKIPRKITTHVSPTAKMTANLSLHYWRTTLSIVQEFQRVWSYVVNNQSTLKNGDELLEYLHGISTRFEQLFFSIDIIKELSEKEPDNDILFLTNYHVFQLISTLKTVADNLAALLQSYYEIVLAPKNVSLHSPQLKTQLQNHKWMYKTIYDSKYWPIYSKLVEFRDVIQHRHALHVMITEFATTHERKILVPIDPSTDSLRNFGFAGFHASDPKGITEY